VATSKLKISPLASNKFQFTCDNPFVPR